MQEINGLINSDSLQIQRSINEANNERLSPQNQVPLGCGSRQMPLNGWNVPAERPEYRSEGTFNRKFRSSS